MLDQQQLCPDCDEPLDYVGFHKATDGQTYEWWYCPPCGEHYTSIEIEYANRNRVLRDQYLAELCGQLPLPLEDHHA